MTQGRDQYLDHPLFWNAADLERKLALFQRYYNGLRVHQGLDGDTPDEQAGSPSLPQTSKPCRACGTRGTS
jgi:hypothetical protein